MDIGLFATNAHTTGVSVKDEFSAIYGFSGATSIEPRSSSKDFDQSHTTLQTHNAYEDINLNDVRIPTPQVDE